MHLPGEFLDVSQEGGAFVVSLRRCLEERLGLRLRRKETLARARWHLKPVHAVRLGDGLTFSVPASASQARLMRAAKNVEENLRELAHRPLTASQVERTLGIAGPERIRWTKDGRLASSGSHSIRRGQAIALATYPVDGIQRLMNDASVIRKWREDDSRPKS